jgi:hypothetical protein
MIQRGADAARLHEFSFEMLKNEKPLPVLSVGQAKGRRHFRDAAVALAARTGQKASGWFHVLCCVCLLANCSVLKMAKPPPVDR